MSVSTWTSTRTIRITRGLLTLALVGLGMMIPRVGLPQAITGPMVNAMLIAIVETTGVGAAVLVGLSTPLSALGSGVLPLPMMVMIPFIGIGNALLSIVYGALKGRNRWLALVAGAVCKFAWLYGVTAWLVARPLAVAIGETQIAVQLPAALVGMMQWPQLLTALAGGVLAMGLFKVARVPAEQ